MGVAFGGGNREGKEVQEQEVAMAEEADVTPRMEAGA